ncbi:hypothetical protein GCM10023189_37750 [Nibrella saemangeumensis]|uniref:Uncharacterized protein n=1 Tax=Nibrella saemangeumensis TaxID=1084526 RepID=A0ABP8NA43_9BACT
MESVNAPLPALRVLLKKLSIPLVPMTHQVNAIPNDSQLEFYFVPAEHMAMFKEYNRPGKPFKNFKLVNFERPAISLSFFVKHKYTLDRNVTPDRAMEYLREHRDALFEQSFLNPLNKDAQKELNEADRLLRLVRDQPEKFQFCFSNFHHYYRYWYCSYRYFEDEEQTLTASANEHLLKHSERVKGKINERANVIFVDPEYITRPVPYDNKMADRELATYGKRFTSGTVALYLREIE